MYGLLLVVMMLAKPEGFWPEKRRRQELKDEKERQLASQVAESES